MTSLRAELQADQIGETTHDTAAGYSDDGDVVVRITNDAAENGYEQEPGPLRWLNSARLTADPGDDAIHCVISIGDPRGGFGFTVRRLSDGRIVLHLPYPGESLAHEDTAELHPGTLVVVHEAGNPDRPADYSDPEPDDDDDADDDDDDDDDEQGPDRDTGARALATAPSRAPAWLEHTRQVDDETRTTIADVADDEQDGEA